MGSLTWSIWYLEAEKIYSGRSKSDLEKLKGLKNKEFQVGIKVIKIVKRKSLIKELINWELYLTLVAFKSGVANLVISHIAWGKTFVYVVKEHISYIILQLQWPNKSPLEVILFN